MLYPHNLFEIIRHLDRIEKIQKYSILTSHQGKKELVESIGEIRQMINEELNTQKAAIMQQIGEHNAARNLENQGRDGAGNKQDGNAPSTGDNPHDRAQSDAQPADDSGNRESDR